MSNETNNLTIGYNDAFVVHRCFRDRLQKLREIDARGETSNPAASLAIGRTALVLAEMEEEWGANPENEVAESLLPEHSSRELEISVMGLAEFTESLRDYSARIFEADAVEAARAMQLAVRYETS